MNHIIVKLPPYDNTPTDTVRGLTLTLPPAFAKYCDTHNIKASELVQVLVDCGIWKA